ncbi:MAG: hypothetical protein KKF30_19250 [Proteobacteria bacterium]|nr:hypothetical protein [Pseudomonadota bacterium]
MTIEIIGKKGITQKDLRAKKAILSWDINYFNCNNMAKMKIKKGKIKCAFCYGKGVLPETEIFKDIKCPVCRGKGFAYLERAIDCVYCGGKGRKTAHCNLSCQVCKGVGAVEMREAFIVCPDCNGAGKKEGEFLPCLTCKGKGVVEKKKQMLEFWKN